MPRAWHRRRTDVSACAFADCRRASRLQPVLILPRGERAASGIWTGAYFPSFNSGEQVGISASDSTKRNA